MWRGIEGKGDIWRGYGGIDGGVDVVEVWGVFVRAVVRGGMDDGCRGGEGWGGGQMEE